MQSANSSPWDSLPRPVVCDDPHAATATTQLTTARQLQTFWLPGLPILLQGCTSRTTNSAVTPLCCRYAALGILAGASRNGLHAKRSPAMPPADDSHRVEARTEPHPARSEIAATTAPSLARERCAEPRIGVVAASAAG